MPTLNLPVVSRRSFALSLAGAAFLRSQTAELHWALLSDTHIPANAADGYRGFQPQENLKKAVEGVLAVAPQGTLICGDVSRLRGVDEDYAMAKTILQPVAERMPLALVLGNHDHRKNLNAAFENQPGRQNVKDRHVLVVESPAVRMVLLDSLIGGDGAAGFLGKAQRAWLGEFLAGSDNRPTLLFVHHTLSDDDGALLDAPRLFDIVRGQKKVKAIVYGHSHRYQCETWEGIQLINIPSVGYNFADDQPIGWVDARFSASGAKLTLHAIGGNTAGNGKTTELNWRA